MATAVLIDGAFFLHRYSVVFSGGDQHSPAQVARALHRMALQHCEGDLYRIFYYDCPPIQKKAHNPVTKRAVDFSRTPQAAFRLAFFGELKRLRKVALRLGQLHGDMIWNVRPGRFKPLLSGEITVADLRESDVVCDVRQKGVDMKLGVDVASLAFKKQVDRIVLVAGDADFIPAAKLARREGIDFILDPMWAPISESLHEHIDGLASKCPNPSRQITTTTTQTPPTHE